MTVPAKVAIVCRLVTKEGRRPELIESLQAILAVVQEEEGTEVYAVNESTADEVTVFVYEIYRDDAAFQVHRGSQAHADNASRLDDLLARPPDVWFASPVDAKVGPLS